MHHIMAALDPQSVPEGFDYYDIDSIMSEESTVPCTLRHGCTGVGRVLDPGADLDDLAPGTLVDLPLWMVQVMAKRQLLEVHLPIYFKDHMRRKLRAGPGCESLKVRCNHFYTVAHKVHSAMVATGHGDDSFPEFIAKAYADRYRELLTKAPTLDSNADASDIQAKLSNEELGLFNAAALSSTLHDRYRANKDGPLWKKKSSFKRPRVNGSS